MPIAVALNLLLSALPASAQATPIFDGTRGLRPDLNILEVPLPAGAPLGWAPVAPDQEPGDANPGAPERSGFWDRLQSGAFDQICKNIKLRTSQHVAVDGLGAGLTVDRELQRTAAGTFALLDRAGLDLGVGFGRSVFEDGGAALGVSVGATLRGESVVVRPLATKKSCDEVKRLVNVLDFKPAIPLSPARIAAMQVGELWRLPLTISVGVGVGARLADLPVTISLGRSEEGRAAVTLYRLSEDQVRFRLRIDKADVVSKGGEVVYSLPGAALGFPETQTIVVEQLMRLVSRELAHQLSRYLTLRLGLSAAKRTGRMLLVEFVLDPKDAGQMAALRDLMRGDLNALKLMEDLAARAGRALAGDRRAAEEAAEIVERHAGELGRDATFVGADDYSRRSSRFAFKIPLLVEHESVSGREDDHILILDQTGGQYDIHKADKAKGTGTLDVPFLGQISKHNTQRTAQVMTYRDGAGNVTEPVAVFVRQEGFLREGAGRARGMAEEADEIARLIGTRGQGMNDRTTLPVEGLFPKDSLMEDARARGPRGEETPQEKSYHRGVTAFTLVFGRQAVRAIASAPVYVIVASYMNALGYAERELLARAAPFLTVSVAGKVSYKDEETLRALGYSGWFDEGARQAMGELQRLAQQAAAVVRDLLRVRDAATPEARAAALLKVMAGDGDSGLAYEDILKVLVQLVDPADVAGEFFVSVEKRIKGEKDVSARLLFNDRMADGAFVGEAARNRARFAEPSVLTD